MKSIMKSAFAIFGVALMVMVAVVPMVGVFSDSGDAAVASASPIAKDVEIQLFDYDPDAPASYYADLIYCDNGNHRLPEGVNATEYVEVLGGVWINVNENSENYGKFLRYGDTSMTVEQILSQSKKDNPINSSWLPLVQLSYTYDQEHANSFEVTHGDTTGYETNAKQGMTKTHYTFNTMKYDFSEVECVVTIKIAQDDEGSQYMGLGSLLPGNYECVFKVNGSTVDETTFSVGDYKEISGRISAKAGGEASTYYINGATVAYTIDGVAGTTVSKKISNNDGSYSFTVPKGSVVAITGVTYPSDVFTFDEAQTLGVISDDTVVNVTAKESVGKITVSDNSAEPIKGASASLTWYQQGQKEGDKYYVNTLSGGKAVQIAPSGTDGVIYYAFIIPSTLSTNYTSKVLVATTSMSGTYYTFTNASISTDTSGEAAQISAQVSGKAGTCYWADTYGAKTTAADQKSFFVTVTSADNGDAELNIEGATITAKWYEQKANGTNPETYTIKSIDGNVWVSSTSGVDGKILVTYKTPTATTGFTAYLWLNASSATGYTFSGLSAPDVGTSVAKSLTEQVAAEYTATACKQNVTATQLFAKEKAYTMTVNFDTSVKATITYTNGVGTSKTMGVAGTTVSFQAVEGKVPVVTPSAIGYTFGDSTFGYPVWTFATVTSNQEVTFKVEEISFDAILSVPHKYGAGDVQTDYTTVGTMYTINLTAVEADAATLPVTFSYKVDDELYTNTILASKTAAPYKYVPGFYIFSWNSVIEFVGVEAEGYTIDVSTGTLPTTAVAADVTIPAIFKITLNGNKVPAVGYEIYAFNAAGVFVQSTFTDLFGKASFTGPTAATQFVYEGYLLTLTDGYYLLDDAIAAEDAPEYFVGLDVSNSIAAHVSVSPVSVITGNQVINVVVGTVLTLTADNEFYENKNSDASGQATLVQKSTFKGWYANGQLISSDPVAKYVLTDDVIISAAYTTELIDNTPAAVEQKQGIDSTTLIIGIVAVVIALIAVAFAVISVKKKE